jgi:hypothetical protein
MAMPSPQFQSPAPKRSLGQRMSDSRQRAKDMFGAQAGNIAAPHLDPGEMIQAGTRVYTGPSDALRWIPRFGSIVRLVQTHYYMLVTDRRVIFVGLSYWGQKPTGIKFMVPRGGLQVSDYNPAAIYPSFRFASAARKPMRLRMRTNWQAEAMQALGILGIQLPGGPGPAVPGYQPGPVPPYQAPVTGYPPQAAGPYQGQPGYQPAPYGQDPQYQPQQGYQPAPPQYEAPQQGYQPAPPQYEAPQQRPGPGRHRGPGA